MIKLLAVDLDGTLLGSNRLPNPASAEALKRCSAAGVHVVLASGRICTTVLPFCEMLGVPPLMVCCNGAHILAADGTEISHTPLPREAAKQVLRFGLERQLHTNLYSRSRIYFYGMDEWAELYLDRVHPEEIIQAGPEVIETVDATKMMFVAGKDTIQTNKPEADALAASLGLHTVLSEPEYLEFLNPGADKGIGIAKVAAYLGLEQHETAAIGDYSNDVQMLEWAGVSAAMGSGNDAAKAAADHIVATNDDGGVAEFVDRFVLPQGP